MRQGEAFTFCWAIAHSSAMLLDFSVKETLFLTNYPVSDILLEQQKIFKDLKIALSSHIKASIRKAAPIHM
jgi:hypothetical protein